MQEIPWTEIGLFWSSSILALITVTAVIVNYLIFRTQVDPEIIVNAMHDDERPSIIILIIENIGKGMARDIHFSWQGKLPKEAFGFEDAAVPEEVDSGPLVNGIPALGPGSKRIITWGQYGGLKKGIGDNIIHITATYKSDTHILPWKNKHSTTSLLDIKSFEGTDASDRNWLKKIADRLEKLERVFEQSASGFRPLQITITNQDDNASQSYIKQS